MKITQLKRLDTGTTAPTAQVRGTEAQDAPVTDDTASRRRRRRLYVAGASSLVLLAAFAWLVQAWSNSSHTVAADRLRIVADGGTLFLDELGNLSGSGQAKLLRVLQTGEFERLGSNTTRRTRVRVIAATDANLRQAIREGRFREDLFYRLNVIEIEVPALAERRDDILALARHFLESPFELTAEAERALLRHSWPGNVRELQNVMRRACLLSGEPAIGVSALNLLPDTQQATDEPTIDRTDIEGALARAGGIVAQAARELGLSRQALYRRMEKLGLKSEVGRPPPPQTS